MTLISLSAKIISDHFGSCKNPEAFVQLFSSRLIPLCRSPPGTLSEELPFPPYIRPVLFCHGTREHRRHLTYYYAEQIRAELEAGDDGI